MGFVSRPPGLHESLPSLPGQDAVEVSRRLISRYLVSSRKNWTIGNTLRLRNLLPMLGLYFPIVASITHPRRMLSGWLGKHR